MFPFLQPIANSRTIQYELLRQYLENFYRELCVYKVRKLGTPLWLLSLFGFDLAKVHVV